MNIQEVKQIRIADYLQSLGYTPVKQQGSSFWYKSPLREETDASFKVNTELNKWYDFGLGKGGNIIALAAELYHKNCIIVIKNVPCLECDQCGEKYYTDEVAERLELIVNMAKKLMQEIAVIDYPQVA